MSGEPLFVIQRTSEKGAFLGATSDILPGCAIFKDSPVLYFSDEFFKPFEAHPELGVLLAGFAAYKLMEPGEQSRFMGLFGPTTGPKADLLRIAARRTLKKSSGEEVELFVRVASIVRLNIFAIDGGYAVYDLLTRMSHSCIPNCKVNFEGTVSVCRVILPIKAGEELTIEYVSDHRLKPTYARRFNYALKKEFTCTCARCAGPGDDTRQFPCFDKECSGRHFACQPLRQEDHASEYCMYTGVEYVEPHLLPCTACAKSPPLKYQQHMFDVETTLPLLYKRLQTEANALPRTELNNLRLVKKIETADFPHTHSEAAPILRLLVILQGQLAAKDASYETEHLQEAVNSYLAVVESVAVFPSATIIMPLFEVGQILYNTGRTSLFPFAAECVQKAVRMQLVAFGRDARLTNVDALLGDLLQKAPAPETDTVTGRASSQCMFCGESPERAALTLSRCGRCLHAAYCSAGCQKAHWKAHKRVCHCPGARSGSG